MDQLTGGPGAAWDALAGRQPAPPLWVLLATAAVALFVVSDLRAWLLARHVVTLAHEGGHAGVALLCGRRVRGVRLHSDTSGLTLSSGRPTGPGMVATGAAGYLMPSVLGLLAAGWLGTGHVVATLAGFLVLLAAIAVAVRNLFGVVSVTCTAAALVAVMFWAPANLQAAFAFALAWFLLLAGPRPVIELQRKRRRGQAPMSDADQLARLTGLPGLFWIGVFLVLTVAMAVGGGYLLLLSTGLV
jgi:Peptidase M50B-like